MDSECLFFVVEAQRKDLIPRADPILCCTVLVHKRVSDAGWMIGSNPMIMTGESSTDDWRRRWSSRAGLDGSSTGSFFLYSVTTPGVEEIASCSQASSLSVSPWALTMKFLGLKIDVNDVGRCSTIHPLSYALCVLVSSKTCVWGCLHGPKSIIFDTSVTKVHSSVAATIVLRWQWPIFMVVDGL